MGFAAERHMWSLAIVLPFPAPEKARAVLDGDELIDTVKPLAVGVAPFPDYFPTKFGILSASIERQSEMRSTNFSNAILRYALGAAGVAVFVLFLAGPALADKKFCIRGECVAPWNQPFPADPPGWVVTREQKSRLTDPTLTVKVVQYNGQKKEYGVSDSYIGKDFYMYGTKNSYPVFTFKIFGGEPKRIVVEGPMGSKIWPSYDWDQTDSVKNYHGMTPPHWEASVRYMGEQTYTHVSDWYTITVTNEAGRNFRAAAYLEDPADPKTKPSSPELKNDERREYTNERASCSDANKQCAIAWKDQRRATDGTGKYCIAGDCTRDLLKEDGHLSEWTECDAKCGWGKKMRICTPPRNGSPMPCIGLEREERCVTDLRKGWQCVLSDDENALLVNGVDVDSCEPGRNCYKKFIGEKPEIEVSKCKVRECSVVYASKQCLSDTPFNSVTDYCYGGDRPHRDPTQHTKGNDPLNPCISHARARDGWSCKVESNPNPFHEPDDLVMPGCFLTTEGQWNDSAELSWIGLKHHAAIIRCGAAQCGEADRCRMERIAGDDNGKCMTQGEFNAFPPCYARTSDGQMNGDDPMKNPAFCVDKDPDYTCNYQYRSDQLGNLGLCVGDTPFHAETVSCRKRNNFKIYYSTLVYDKKLHLKVFASGMTDLKMLATSPYFFSLQLPVNKRWPSDDPTVAANHPLTDTSDPEPFGDVKDLLDFEQKVKTITDPAKIVEAFDAIPAPGLSGTDPESTKLMIWAQRKDASGKIVEEMGATEGFDAWRYPPAEYHIRLKNTSGSGANDCTARNGSTSGGLTFGVCAAAACLLSACAGLPACALAGASAGLASGAVSRSQCEADPNTVNIVVTVSGSFGMTPFEKSIGNWLDTALKPEQGNLEPDIAKWFESLPLTGIPIEQAPFADYWNKWADSATVTLDPKDVLKSMDSSLLLDPSLSLDKTILLGSKSSLLYLTQEAIPKDPLADELRNFAHRSGFLSAADTSKFHDVIFLDREGNVALYQKKGDRFNKIPEFPEAMIDSLLQDSSVKKVPLYAGDTRLQNDNNTSLPSKAMNIINGWERSDEFTKYGGGKLYDAYPIDYRDSYTSVDVRSYAPYSPFDLAVNIATNREVTLLDMKPDGKGVLWATAEYYPGKYFVAAPLKTPIDGPSGKIYWILLPKISQ